MASDKPHLVAVCLTLGISFTILKLMGMCVLPWWVVLIPFWLPLAVLGFGYIVFWLAIGYIYLIVHFATREDEKKDDA